MSLFECFCCCGAPQQSQFVNGAKITGWRLKEFDQEHAVVHRATEGAKKAWRDFKQVTVLFCTTLVENLRQHIFHLVYTSLNSSKL